VIATLARIFGEALDKGPLGADDSFFAAGGDSLAAVGILARIEDELGVELVYRDFLEAPTPIRLGLTILRTRASHHGGDLVTEITALSAEDAARFVAHLKATS
jgi:acyl carrier protein